MHQSRIAHNEILADGDRRCSQCTAEHLGFQSLLRSDKTLRSAQRGSEASGLSVVASALHVDSSIPP